MKKTFGLLAAFIATLSLGIFASCDNAPDEPVVPNPPIDNPITPPDGGDDPVTPPDEGEEYAYTVTVKSKGGMAIPSVTVNVYEGEKLIKSAKTNKKGNVTYFLGDSEYTVVLADVPLGYKDTSGTEAYVLNNEQMDLTVTMDIELVSAAERNGHIYKTGDVMHDFTVLTVDGKTLKLSEILAEKKMVFLNFWYTTCVPCMAELPFMRDAYNDERFTDDVCILAVNNGNDTLNKIMKTVSDLQLPFDVAEYNNIMTHFDTSGGFPTSVIIDRYGVVTWQETGRLEDTNEMIKILSMYTADDYVQSFTPGSTPSTGGSVGGGEEELIKPTVARPSSEAVNAAFAADGLQFDFTFDSNEYVWPFAPDEIDGRTVVKSTNATYNNTSSVMETTITVPENADLDEYVFAFDYKLISEYGGDFFYILVDGMIIHTLSGPEPINGTVPDAAWDTCYAYVPLRAGTYTLSFVYYKDADYSTGYDTVYLDNLRFTTIDEIETNEKTLYVHRNAATQQNATTTDKKNPIPRFDRYVSVVYNETDGFYHVGKADGPLLMASINGKTPWNDGVSLQLLASEGYLYYKDGGETVDLSSIILGTYAWRSNHSLNGLVPVDETLKQLLILITSQEVVGYGYENEWLEFCSYYDHYGVGEHMSSPIQGIDFQNAHTLGDVDWTMQSPTLTFTANHDRLIVPRGVKYAFTPTKDGVYFIRSLTTEADYSLINPVAWIFTLNDSGTDYIEIAYNDNHLDYAQHGKDENFYIYVRMTAGKTYYITCGEFDPSWIGKYDVAVSYHGETLEALTACGTYFTGVIDPSGEMSQGTVYVGDRVNVTVDEDGYCRVLNNDGSMGSYIYLSMLKPTWLLAYSIEEILENPLVKAVERDENGDPIVEDGKYVYKTEKNEDGSVKTDENGEPIYVYEPFFPTHVTFDLRQLDLGDGVKHPDYTETMKTYLAQAKQNEGELYGYVKVTAELRDILRLYTIQENGGIEWYDAWQMLCYYYCPVL